MIEPLAPRQIVRVRISRAGERRGIAQRRQLVLRAEGVEVEGRRGGGDPERRQTSPQ